MAFIGLNVAMVIISLPSLDIHIVDNISAVPPSDPHYDKLWKICPLLKILGKTAPNLYSFHQ